MTTTATATAAFAPEQEVVIDLGITKKVGRFVEAAARDGYLTVRYDTARGEKVADVRATKVTAVAVDTDGIDDLPGDDVPVVDVTDDVTDTVEDGEQGEQGDATPVKKPRGKALPNGYVTPYGLAAIINKRGLYTGTREGGVSTQMVYGYMNASAGGANAFPGEQIDGRLVVEIEAGVAWWAAKNERVAARRAGAGTRRRTPARVARVDVVTELEKALASEDPIAAVRAYVEALGTTG